MKKGMKTEVGFDFFGTKLRLRRASYRNGGRTALFLETQSGEPFTDLTVNIPTAPLDNGELIIRAWDVNEDIAKAALQSGLFVDTGKRIPSGFVEAQVWRFTDPNTLNHIPAC